MEVQAVTRRGRRGIDRITFGVREKTDPRHTPGYDMENELKWKRRCDCERVRNLFTAPYRSRLAIRDNGLPLLNFIVAEASKTLNYPKNLFTVPV